MHADELGDVLRQAMVDDGRTLYELAKEARMETDQLYRFRDGADLRITTASKLARVLGLELRPKKRSRNVR